MMVALQTEGTARLMPVKKQDLFGIVLFEGKDGVPLNIRTHRTTRSDTTLDLKAQTDINHYGTGGYSNIPLNRYIRQHGIGSISPKILERDVPEDQIAQRKQYWIDELHPTCQGGIFGKRPDAPTSDEGEDTVLETTTPPETSQVVETNWKQLIKDAPDDVLHAELKRRAEIRNLEDRMAREAIELERLRNG